MCGLDYSPINNNIYSFVGFSWSCTLLFPVLMALYFYTSIYKSGLCECYPGQPTPASDSHLTHVLALTTVTSLLLTLPIYSVNLLAGLGYEISHFLHTFSGLLSFATPASLSCIYLISSGHHFNCSSFCKSLRRTIRSIFITGPRDNRARQSYANSTEVMHSLLTRSQHSTTGSGSVHTTPVKMPSTSSPSDGKGAYVSVSVHEPVDETLM